MSGIGSPVTSGRSRLSALVPVLALAGIVVSLQQTVVIPLIPLFPRLLGAPPEDTAWVVTATLLAGAVATPVVGRLADMVGKRRMLLVCLVVLVAGSVIGALSNAVVPLVVGRALQGLATGVVPLGISLMRDLLPPERLGSATALMSASLGVGGALGLPLAALVAQSADWHAVFWMAGGLGALATLLVLTIVPESPQRTGGRFDLVGALGLSVVLVGLLLAVSKGGTWGWASSTTLTLFAVAAVVLLAWFGWELRVRAPLVDLRVSARRQVLLTNAAAVVFGFAMFAMSLVYPQLLQLPTATGYGLGQSILVSGLVLAPGGLCMMAASPLSARISAASGPRTTLMAGAVVVAVGYALSTLFHASVWQLVIASAVVSSGVGLAYGALPALVMAAVPVTQTASANSLNNLMRAIGLSAASAVAGVLLASLTTPFGSATVPSHDAFRLVMVLGGVAALVALVVAVFIPRRAPVPSPPPAAPAPPPYVRAGVEGAAPSAVTGVVRHAGEPAPDAVVSVVRADGRQLGRARTDRDGRYAVPAAGTGPFASPLLVVVRWGELGHAEFLGASCPQVRDLDLAPSRGRPHGRPPVEVTVGREPTPAG